MSGNNPKWLISARKPSHEQIISARGRVFGVLSIGLVACGKGEKYEDVVQQEKTEDSESSLVDENEDEVETMEETEEVEVTTKADVIEEVDDGIIRFRGIRWYSAKKDVESFLFENGAESGGWMSSDNDIYRMSGIDYTSVTTGEDRVDGGGYQGWYSGVSVAGYEASDTYACYIYPMNADGSINMSEDDAQFYFGWYTFTQEDYSDITAIYEDLKTKLCTLYGDGQENETDFHTTMSWKDVENNQVRLLRNSDLVGGEDFRIDLLFFHRGLQCLIAFELKIGKFKPEYISKMDFHLEALDRQKKKDNENPSVGMILCASKDDEVVEYAMSRTLSPMMVAEYKLQLPDKAVLQKKLQELVNMPLIEE